MKVRIGYLVQNLNDPAVERRCTMLERGGAKVRLAGFCRDRTLHADMAARDPLLLGYSRDSALAHRALSTLQAAAFHRELRRFFTDCDVIVARNLEQLGIARTIVGERPLVFECLDIHRMLVGDSMPARLVQSIEKMLLPSVNLLLTSSPAFVENHFAHTNIDCPVRILENRLLVDTGNEPRLFRADPHWPICIGWFGMLRCRRTLSFLTEIVEASAGKIQVLIAGRPSDAELPNFENEVATISGMNFVGAYSRADLAELYGRCHFAWTIDWFEEGLNSSWLLPNRLYEALAHGVIPIALSEVEVGRWLSRHDAGLLAPTPAQIRDRLLDLSPLRLSELQNEVRRIDQGELLADDEDCKDLVDQISKLVEN